MSSFVSQNQSAFIAGRDIVDNVLFMQESKKLSQGRGGVPSMLLKWIFKRPTTLYSGSSCFMYSRVMHFPELMIGWIKECVCTAHFSISVNGFLEGYFAGKQGLRQGDLLSPYLFLLVMESFSCVFTQNIQVTTNITLNVSNCRFPTCVLQMICSYSLQLMWSQWQCLKELWKNLVLCQVYLPICKRVMCSWLV